MSTSLSLPKTAAATLLLLVGLVGYLPAADRSSASWSPNRPTPARRSQPAPREEYVEPAAYDDASYDSDEQYAAEYEVAEEPAASARIPRAERRTVSTRTSAASRPRSMSARSEASPAQYSRPAIGTGLRTERPVGYETYLSEETSGPLLAPGEQIVVGEAHLAAGETYYEGEIPYSVMPGRSMGDCGPNCGPGGCGLGLGCASCPPRTGKPCCICIPCPTLETLELSAGVHGFTGPANRGGTSSFGFHEGFNWGTPLYLLGLAGQIGASGTHSNFDGSSLTTNDRNQLFVTAGLYRRVDCGLQAGVVVDYFHDEWDYAVDLVQLRGEISYRFNECNEIGFWFTQGMNDDSDEARQVVPGTAGQFIDREVNFEITDLYAFFYRRQFRCGGEGRLYGGFTSESQGLVGGDLRIQFSQKWAIENSFTYVTSGGNDDIPDYEEDSWNVAINLVWTPFAGRRGSCVPHPCRALLPVAHNGNFITRLTTP